jgi:hypothetical protein
VDDVANLVRTVAVHAVDVVEHDDLLQHRHPKPRVARRFVELHVSHLASVQMTPTTGRARPIKNPISPQAKKQSMMKSLSRCM